ncbi:mediator of RNA polymerase II transcription subunit 14 isoform X3 [Nematostella vectensis]|uniref:mediator of RNA polymerase II transcription subunit 14 isoform X3 n=1 Tax=Nematostella vectensis TaxID=45351 RepID=UPI002077976E|nr:mediator of RNA polymerase II transcription subunit 14 isoform X3 [Nematostella vectensis]
MAAPEVPSNKINLSMLIDFLLQKTYHELTVLSELLPRKPDIERKIEIVQFASRTRQQFVRLLALVKWAGGAKGVAKCQAISTFLDQQSMVFVDTADMLARMARETLVQARLPTFCLPAAVDVLTTGTYQRLPTCIRDKIVPPDPLSLSEKNKTLQRLNEVIQHRLVLARIPPQMASLKIADGCVTFHVDNEFEVSLTLMGDDPALPWRLLSINILVEDIETGDGKPLVHQMQINYIHQLIQSRLFNEESPLVDLYNCLHSFCLSLQLQVLHFQAKQLIHERWHENVKIESYAVGKTLTLSYWRTSPSQHSQRQVQGHAMTISYQSDQNPGYLSISHQPPLPVNSKEDCLDKPSNLCIERLLMQSVRLQSITNLKNLLSLLSEHINSKVLLDRCMPSLAIQTCKQATPSEVLIIAVDTRTGNFKVSLGDGEENLICTDMEKALNADPQKFPTLLGDARCQLHLHKCRRSVSLLPIMPLSYLPLTEVSRGKLCMLSKHHMFLKFKNHPNFFLVVEVSSAAESDKVCVKYSLLRTKSVDVDNLEPEVSRRDSTVKQEDKGGASMPAGNVQPLFLAVKHIVEVSPERMTDFPGTMIKGFSDGKMESVPVKRKHDYCEEERAKRIKTTTELYKKCTNTSSFQAELSHIVCSCDGRIPFVSLCEDLRRHGVVHSGVTSEAAVGLCVEIPHLPTPQGCKEDLVTTLHSNMISCTLRFSGQEYAHCDFEMYFAYPPFLTDSEKLQAKRIALKYAYTQPEPGASEPGVVQKFLDDWCCICKLYAHALDLDMCIKDNQSHVRHMFRVESYTYRQLTLQYEPDRQNMVTVEWSVAESKFLLSFSHSGSSDTDNPHRIMAEQLQKDFNKRLNLPYLMQILHETWKPLTALGRLPTRPTLGVITRPLMPYRTFAVIPQSPTSVHLLYRPTHALEIHFKAKNLLSIRDASISSVDPTKPMGMLQTITNLKLFLQIYVDDIAKAGGIPSRRASGADDEGPPSPLNTEMEPPIDVQFTSPQPMPGRNSSPIVPRASPQPPTARPYGTSPGTSAMSPSNPYSSPSPITHYMVNSPAPYHPMASPAMSPGGQVPKYRQSGAVAVTSKLPTTPPRPLIARGWALTTPTILSHAAFTKLCSPVMSVGRHGNVSPLEMFMGSMFLKKHFSRAAASDDLITIVKADASRILFKVNNNSPQCNLQCVLSMDTKTFTSLRLNLSPIQPQDTMWTHDVLRTLERFFDTRVACPPYKANSMTSFVRILTAAPKILLDLIRLIKLEMNPDPSHKWRVEWCLSMPPSAPEVAPPGTPAVVLKAKIFIFIELTRQGVPGGAGTRDESSVFVPLLYHPQTNTTQQAEMTREPGTQSSSSAAISAFLRRWNESVASKTTECTLFLAVQELAKNLVLPTSPSLNDH